MKKLIMILMLGIFYIPAYAADVIKKKPAEIKNKQGLYLNLKEFNKNEEDYATTYEKVYK